MTTSATYLLEPDAAPLAATGGGSTTSVPNALPTVGQRTLLLPFRRNERDDFANAGGEEAWIARVLLVLSIRGPTERGVGEIPWRPQDGASLHLLRHQNNTRALGTMAKAYVIRALQRSLPAVRVVDVVATRPAANTLHLAVRFDVVDRRGPRFQGLAATVQVAAPTT